MVKITLLTLALTTILKIGVKMLSIRKVCGFLLYFSIGKQIVASDQVLHCLITVSEIIPLVFDVNEN